jgi:hypothetical protein
MAFRGSSTVMLKCGEIKGRQPSMTSRRYALNALVVSFRGILKIILRKRFAHRFKASFNFKFLSGQRARFEEIFTEGSEGNQDRNFDLKSSAIFVSFCSRFSSATIITASEVFLQPQIQTDKHVTAAHFLDLQFGFPRPAAAPGDWDRDPRVTADNGF